MPDGSSSAAPVTTPGPRTRHRLVTLRHGRCRSAPRGRGGGPSVKVGWRSTRRDVGRRLVYLRKNATLEGEIHHARIPGGSLNLVPPLLFVSGLGGRRRLPKAEHGVRHGRLANFETVEI